MSPKIVWEIFNFITRQFLCFFNFSIAWRVWNELKDYLMIMDWEFKIVFRKKYCYLADTDSKVFFVCDFTFTIFSFFYKYNIQQSDNCLYYFSVYQFIYIWYSTVDSFLVEAQFVRVLIQLEKAKERLNR